MMILFLPNFINKKNAELTYYLSFVMNQALLILKRFCAQFSENFS